jgi:signal transduction histidine kinase/CheY-like chemotaxis protein
MIEYRILHIEDSATDVDLVKRILKKAGLHFQYFVADTKESLIKGLTSFNPNVILCDHSLPQFDSVQAFEIYEEMTPDIAFLLVTGSVSEEYAVEMMRKGIDDYLIKDNLQRLPKAIENAYTKREKERLRKLAEAKLEQSELLLNKAQQIARIGSWELNLKTGKEIWSNEIFRILGLKPEEVVPSHQRLLSFIHPGDLDFVTNNVDRAHAEFRDMSFYSRIIREDNSVRHIHYESKFEFDKQQKPLRLNGIIQDITEKVLADAEKEFDQKNLSALINNTTDLIWSVNKDFKLITSNLAFDQVVKLLSRKPLIKGGNILETEFDEERLARWQKYYTRAFSGETFSIIEEYESSWSEISFYPIRKGTSIIGTACYSRDITEKLLAEGKREFDRKNLSALINNTEDLIWSIDIDFKMITSNSAFDKRMKLLLGKHIANGDNILQPGFGAERLALFKKFYEDAFSGKTFTETEYNDGTWSEISFYPISKENKVIGTACYSRNITEQKNTEQDILQKNEQLKNLTSHLQHIREEERTSIAREIHDELGQQLTALKMDIDWVLHKQDDAEEAVVNKLDEMLHMSDGIINTIRRISSDLRPAIIDDLGLIAALEWKCHDFEEKMGVPCQFVSTVKERKFENDFGINAYRILQETLTNVTRHSKAKSVKVSVSENEDELFLEISDDGKGISPENIQNGKTLGIVGMKERAALLGGKLIIEGTKNKGTRTRLILPLKNEYINS